MSRVFISTDTSFDVGPAETYGTIVTLMDKFFSPFGIDSFFSAMSKGLEKHGFNPDEDFIAITGSQIHTVLLCLFIQQKYSKIKILMWDAKHREYRARTIECEKILLN